MNESELVALLKIKDRQAFKELVETWQDMVYNTSIGFLQNEEDAEDISQEVFIKVYQSIYSFKGQSKLSTWIYRITVSKCLDHLRKKKRKKRFAFMQGLYGNDDTLATDPPDFIHPGVKTESKEKSIALFKAIDKLPENQKTAFVLNKVEELSYREISEIMDSSESAVDSLLQRAKKNLQILLRDALA